MKKIDIVGIAFGNFMRRKTRSILTVSGVIIGVSSIVVMVSLGIAVNVTFEKSMNNMGDLTTISVYPGQDQKTGEQKGNLDAELVEKLKLIDKVTAVSPEISLNGKIVAGKYLNYANIKGIDMSLLDELGFKPEWGTADNMVDSSIRDIKVIVGSEVAYSFYNPRERNRSGNMMMGGMGGDMIGGGGEGEVERDPPPVDLTAEDLRLKYTFDYSYGEKKQPGMDTSAAKKPVLYKMTPAIILEQSMGEKDRSMYVDLTVAEKLKAESEKYYASNSGSNVVKKKKKLTYDSIKVIVDTMDDSEAVTKEIRLMGYEAWGAGESAGELKKLSGVLQLILGGIGSISLLVAAIGITNTMIMSIYERTKEIGIMKVIGCQLKDIKAMFLYEAAFIGLFGGAIGLLISYGLSAILNLVGKGGGEGGGFMGMGGGAKLSVIPPWLAISAVVFAIMVGLISGFLPARRAMKLSALEAMRN